jgi:hypothetical protein
MPDTEPNIFYTHPKLNKNKYSGLVNWSYERFTESIGVILIFATKTLLRPDSYQGFGGQCTKTLSFLIISTLNQMYFFVP